MKNLDERCEKLISGILHGDSDHKKWLRDTFTPQLKTFALQIRNETLEEAASLKRPYTMEAYRQQIRAFKDTAAPREEGE